MVEHVGRLRRLALLFLAVDGAILSLVGGASAQPDDATCRGYGALSDKPTLRLGRITDKAPHTHFTKDSDDDKACPSAAESCRAKAFVVPGDLVILGRTFGAFVCADYVGAKGQEHMGWLPSDAVAIDSAPPPTIADWMGTWTRIEATIVLKPGPEAGQIAVKGDATWGALDPGRVKRGAVNLGDIEGVEVPSGSDLAFTMAFVQGTETTLPVDKGDAFDCKVWMKRLGPYLLVDDDNNCGGMNVTFRGTYLRKK